VNEGTASEEHLQIGRESVEYVRYPRRSYLHVERIHWDRLRRYVSQVPKDKTLWRDLCFTCLGIAIPTLATAITLVVITPAVTAWVHTLYWCIAIASSVACVLCFLFNQETVTLTSSGVSEILQDMDDIRSYSGMYEETVAALSATSSGERV
jgi:hypothetical protein